ncbi:EamA family transporter [Litchfieldia alkalitelluris]|uniref:EamA family transporter n=1 Tax=Litchfieldia alkalitelluris TaxID=304268 RepID=UPI001F32072A|nr:EamA family transporter [Litchfieldia alkalitelluris]
MGSVASFFIKKSTLTGNIFSVLKSNYLYIGCGLYFLSALLNIYLLKVLPYTVVLPLTSITYIWSFIIAYIYLKEKITYRKIVGISFIILGALVLSLVQGVA